MKRQGSPHAPTRHAIPTQITEATLDDKPIIQNLLQLYLYDLTEFEPKDVEQDGMFRYGFLDAYWTEPGRSILLMRLRGLPAGFSMVNEHSVLNPSAEGIRTVAEFFVIRNLRRLGFGVTLATQTFRRRPGRWEVGQMASNRPAIACWRRAIGEYTGGRFVEPEVDDHCWRGPVQTFDNSPMVG